MPRNVGFVGVGIMGQRMCKNLIRAGFTVWAYDLNPAAVQLAAGLGATAAPDLSTLIAASTLQLYNAARAAGSGKLDQTAVSREMEKLAGIALGILTSDR